MKYKMLLATLGLLIFVNHSAIATPTCGLGKWINTGRSCTLTSLNFTLYNDSPHPISHSAGGCISTYSYHPVVNPCKVGATSHYVCFDNTSFSGAVNASQIMQKKLPKGLYITQDDVRTCDSEHQWR